MKCLVLAAGYATRLYPLTENFPKPLLEVRGKTIIDYLLDDLDQTNMINEYIIVSNHEFINHFNNWANNKKLSHPITIIDDGTMTNENRLGAVVDIALAINKLNIDEELLVAAGDNLLDFSLEGFINYYNNKQSTCIIRYFENNIERIKKSAYVLVDDDDLVLKMEEKSNEPKSNWCCPAFYIYSRDTVKMVNEAIKNNCSSDAPGSFIAYIYDKVKVYAYLMPGKRYDIGNMESYQYACDNYSGMKKKKLIEISIFCLYRHILLSPLSLYDKIKEKVRGVLYENSSSRNWLCRSIFSYITKSKKRSCRFRYYKRKG